VNGPIVVTHTERDLALAEFYPKASLIRGQDAAAQNNLLKRWGAMGWHGAQEVDAATVKIGPVGTSYKFRDGQFLNLDCNALITDGPWPFGSHSDIVHGLRLEGSVWQSPQRVCIRSRHVQAHLSPIVRWQG
jgi:hypothetical protein